MGDAFGKIPTLRLMSGAYAGCDRNEWAVLCSIAGHVDGIGWTARIGLDRISAETGTSRRTVRRALRRLESKGHIASRKGVGRGHVSSYTLSIKADTIAVPFSGDKSGQPSDPLSSIKGDKSTSKRGQSGTEKGSNRTLKGDTLGVPPSTEQQNSRTAQPCLSRKTPNQGKPTDPVAAALDRLQIRNPARGKLLTAWAGISWAAETIRDVAGRATGRGAAGGVIIPELFKAAREARVLKDRQDAVKAESAELTRFMDEAKAQCDAERVQREAFLVDRTDPELYALRDQMMQDNAFLDRPTSTGERVPAEYLAETLWEGAIRGQVWGALLRAYAARKPQEALPGLSGHLACDRST